MVSLSDTRPVPRRGLSRNESAMYFGIGTSKFDELCRSGLIPKPKLIGGRKVWDVRELDLAFEEFPEDNASSTKTGSRTSWEDV
jgi:hypothetical protein